LALWHEKTGEAAAKDEAFRSFTWASYACDANGVVKVGPDDNEGYWFSDGYGDYIRHFLRGLGAIPEWAPPHEARVLRTTSIVTSVARETGLLRWATADASSTDVVRLPSAPKSVKAGGVALEARTDLAQDGFVQTSLSNGGVALRVAHGSAREVEISY
jgi:hypothetical protein